MQRLILPLRYWFLFALFVVALVSSAVSPMSSGAEIKEDTLKKPVQADTNVKDVPLTEVPALPGIMDTRLAVMLSGDGGWAPLDRAVAGGLAKHGIAVVGWDSLSYFWKAKTPEQAGNDLERVLQHYLRTWQRQKILLIGYSFGADVLAFMANRLAADLRERVELVAFLGLSHEATFEFHLSEWLGSVAPERALPVRPEVEKLTWTKRLCIYGAEDVDSGCPALGEAGVKVVKVPGDHHFGEDYQGLVTLLLEQLSPRVAQ